MTTHHISITADKVTTSNDWQRRGVNWLTTIRRAVMSSGTPVFVLRYNDHGTLFFRDGQRFRQKTWRTVRIIRPIASQ